MTSGYPCPNPACTHVFSPDSVTGAASLKCPRCGTVFRFRPASARPAPPARVEATPPPASEGFPVAFDPAPAVIRLNRRARKRRPPWVRAVVWAALGVVVLILVFRGIPWMRDTVIPWFNQQYAANNPEVGQIFAQVNCRFVFPGGKWKLDDKVRLFGVAQLLAMRRPDPNAWMVLAARDYQKRAPRDGEMVEEAVNRLGNYFQGVEWELKPDEEWAGQRAQRLRFQGDVNQVVMTGDCLFFTNKGLGYWLATWTPAALADQSREELHQVRQGFSLLRERDGWQEATPPVQTFQGHKVVYSLRDTEDLWKEWPNPKDVEADADLLLQARDRLEAKDVDKMAQAVVLVEKKQPDLTAAARAARAHLEEQQRQLYPATTLEVIRDQEGPQDWAAPIGEVPGHLTKFRVKNSPDRQRFVVLAVVQLPEQVLAIQCECDWKRRSLWAGDFKQLLSTFSLKTNQ